MTKTELLEAMREAQARWEAALARVPPERFTEPTMHGGWSVKDTVGHVAYYERWLLDWLQDAVRGKITIATHRDLLNADQRNVLIYQENKDRSLEEILAQARQVHDRLYQYVRLLPEAELFDPHRYEHYVLPFWEESRPLWRCIASDSYAHYDEHTSNILAWLECQGKTGEAAAPKRATP